MSPNDNQVVLCCDGCVMTSPWHDTVDTEGHIVTSTILHCHVMVTSWRIATLSHYYFHEEISLRRAHPIVRINCVTVVNTFIAAAMKVLTTVTQLIQCQCQLCQCQCQLCHVMVTSWHTRHNMFIVVSSVATIFGPPRKQIVWAPG